MPTDHPISQPQEGGVGQPQRDPRSSDILHVEIAKIQSDGEYLKRDLSEVRVDMKEIRDRMTKLEVEVRHLPSKEFIVAVILTAMTIIGALIAIAPKLQSLIGTAPK